MTQYNRKADAIKYALRLSKRYVLWNRTFKAYEVSNHDQGLMIVWDRDNR